MLPFVSLLFLSLIYQHNSEPISTLFCGDIASSWLDKNETHIYRFITNLSYDIDVNVQTCFSANDIELAIHDAIGNLVSDEHCPNGDWCGECDNDDNYAENFTIPQMNGTYYITVTPWNTKGSYELQIGCTNASLPVPLTTSSSSPNNTMTYTTFSSLDACPYCKGQIYCGTMVLDTLNGTSTDYYYFETSTTQSVLFDSCGTHMFSELILYDLDWNWLAMGSAHTDCTTFGQQLAIVTSNDGYILGIGRADFGVYQISAVCRDISATDIFHQDQVECGEILHGAFNVSFNHYYSLNLSSNGLLTMHSCGSSSDAFMYLYDLNLTLLHEPQNSGYCWYLWIPDMIRGMYYVKVAGFGGYHTNIEINCANNERNIEYELLTDTMMLHAYETATSNWFDAEVLCEQLYGTTLATIVTSEDMEVVNWMMDPMLRSFVETVWIGMYRDVQKDSKWQWVDGTSWNSTIMEEPDLSHTIDTFMDDLTQVGAFLRFTKSTVTTRGTAFPFLHSVNGSVMGICNAPTAKYKPRSCTNTAKCWRKTAFYYDDYLIADTANSPYYHYHEPPIAFWNSTLFVAGLSDIHYATITTFDIKNATQYTWNRITYNDEEALRTDMISQRFSQHDSSLFLYVYKPAAHYYERDQDILIHINLSNWEIQQHIVPNILPQQYVLPNYTYSWWDSDYQEMSDYCVLSSPNYVYIIRPLLFFIFDRNENTWSSADFVNRVPMTCAITNDYQYIYIFGDIYEEPGTKNLIIKYNTESQKYDVLSVVNLCLYSRAKAVTALNDKIYLHGCHPASWRTLVFDTKTEQFETETIGLDSPIPYNIPFYRFSQMAVVDDNLLLLLHPKNTLYPALYHDPSNSTYVALYVGVTESISINLEATVAILTERIWPSDGFVIRYYVNDFTKVNSTDNTYHVYFDSKNHSIAFVIELSTTHDTCNCNELNYKCNSCAHHVELSNHLSVADNVMDKLSFNINYYMNDLDVLFIPSQLTIMLQRCIINFTLSEVTVYESFIDFEFHLSPNCFSRVGSTFSLDIVSQVIDLSE
eukprot:918197_1